MCWHQQEITDLCRLLRPEKDALSSKQVQYRSVESEVGRLQHMVGAQVLMDFISSHALSVWCGHTGFRDSL